MSNAAAPHPEPPPPAEPPDWTLHLELLLATQRDILLVQEPAAVVMLGLERAGQLTGTASAALWVPSAGGPECTELELEAAHGALAQLLPPRLPRDGSLAGRCLEEARVCECPDAGGLTAPDAQVCVGAGLRSLLAAPLLEGPEVTGVLLLAAPAAFSRRDVLTAEMLAAMLSTSLGHARTSRAREAALAALRQTEEQFRSTFEHSPTGVLLMGPAGHFLRVNPALCQLLGFREEELLGREVRAVTHPDDVPACARLMAELSEGRCTHASMEKRYLHRDGRVVWTQVHASLVRDGAGRPLHFLHQVQDVTARRRAQEALERKERELRALIDELPALVSIRRGDRLLYVNPAWARTQGYASPRELVGRSVLSQLHPDDRARMVEQLPEVVQGARAPHPAELRVLTPTGEALTWEFSAESAITFEGQEALLGVARDVTEQKRLQARLQLADRMATVGTLAAGVAHEINNPLAFVAGNLSWLADELSQAAPQLGTERAAELLEAVREAQTGADRVRVIVRDLHCFSREDDGGMGPVELERVLEQAASMAANHIRHRAHLVRDYAPVPPVEGNAGRLGQVVLNLLVNAAHAIPAGHADAHTIRLALRPAGEGWVELTVADTGVGIDPRLLPRIFDPFFTTKSPGQGTGLGLAICHGIVQAHGGDISVRSEPGRGTTFTVTLRTCRRQAPEPPAASPPPPLSPTRALRVLVVDDELAVGATVRRMLGEGHLVEVHTRAGDALAAVAAGGRFDVVLCDVMMPEVSGLELYGRLETLAPELLPRLLFMTGGAFTPEAQAFLERLPTPPLEKPFGAEALRRAVRERVEGWGALG